MAKNELVGP